MTETEREGGGGGGKRERGGRGERERERVREDMAGEQTLGLSQLSRGRRRHAVENL